jgi:AcrR family transcriptional regulator
MAIAASGKMDAAAGKSVRAGRPPKECAGEVEDRILDAARHVFLNRGYEGATIDEIAETAHAGKPTIYARYGNKRQLFAAAFERHLTVKTQQVRSQALAGGTLRERLEAIAAVLLRQALTAESVGLFRLAIAEARQFPEFAAGMLGAARERGFEIVAQLMIEAAEAGEIKNVTPYEQEKYIRAAVPYFVDLIILPQVIRALSGENLDQLREGIGAHLADRVPFFLAACFNGGIPQGSAGTCAVCRVDPGMLD